MTISRDTTLAIVIQRLCLLTGVPQLVALAFQLAGGGGSMLNLLWSVGQVGNLVCLYCLHRNEVNGSGRIRKLTLLVPAFGATMYLAGWLTLLAGRPVIALYPLGALFSGVGMLLVGVQVVRTGTWDRWRKWTPVLVGLYPFVVMFPYLVITGSPSHRLIALWGVPWLLLALAINERQPARTCHGALVDVARSR